MESTLHQSQTFVSLTGAPRYQPYTLRNFRDIPQAACLSEAQKFAIEVVGRVLPFRTNNYVVDELIDWDNVPADPMFLLNFPQQEMLKPPHFAAIATLLKAGASEADIREVANRIRLELDPHPAGQLHDNVPTLDGEGLAGVQHKYEETVLFFPNQGQTCHAYCTFCFRWAQFVGIDALKIASCEAETLVEYVSRHPEVTDVLFTGGDPLIMRTKTLAQYVEPLLAANIPHLHNIRFGSKALSYWPYRFLTDADADNLLALFQQIVDAGKHVALMAHLNHPRELATGAVRSAIQQIRETGAQIRTQSPLLAHINDDPALWAELWQEQVKLGCIPYYMFVARNTGAQHYFGVPLVRAWEIYRAAYSQVSGLSRTVRGPSMSAHPGKVQILGVTEVDGKEVLALQMLQGRDPDWVARPFFAKYDEDAIWLDELRPAFGQESFFFE